MNKASRGVGSLPRLKSAEWTTEINLIRKKNGRVTGLINYSPEAV
jgi:hypothetical protein